MEHVQVQTPSDEQVPPHQPSIIVSQPSSVTIHATHASPQPDHLSSDSANAIRVQQQPPQSASELVTNESSEIKESPEITVLAQPIQASQYHHEIPRPNAPIPFASTSIMTKTGIVQSPNSVLQPPSFISQQSNVSPTHHPSFPNLIHNSFHNSP